MDRQLEPQVILRRRLRRIGIGLAIVAAMAVSMMLISGWVQPSLRRGNLRIATVTRGPLDMTIEANGIVVPAFERSVSTPVDARVLRLIRHTGDRVRIGDPLVELDLSESRLALERLEQQLVQQQSNVEKSNLQAAHDIAVLQRQLEQKRLDVEMSRYRAEQNRKLRLEGLVSEDTAREAQIALRKGEIEIGQLEASISEERATGSAQQRGDLSQLHLLVQERDQAKRQLELGTARSDRDGIVTWITPEEGATVHRGEAIARIADLSSFRVEGSVSDMHAQVLHAGQAVRVHGEGGFIEGHVTSVNPSASDGSVKFLIDLEGSTELLHNKQRVDLFIVTSQQRDALKVERGSFADEGNVANVWVVEGDRATRRQVRLGASGSEEIEVINGLRAGESVIVSDMRDYQRLKEVRIR